MNSLWIWCTVGIKTTTCWRWATVQIPTKPKAFRLFSEWSWMNFEFFLEMDWLFRRMVTLSIEEEFTWWASLVIWWCLLFRYIFESNPLLTCVNCMQVTFLVLLKSPTIRVNIDINQQRIVTIVLFSFRNWKPREILWCIGTLTWWLLFHFV